MVTGSSSSPASSQMNLEENENLRAELDRVRGELDEQTELASDLFEEIATLHRIGTLMGSRMTMEDLHRAVLDLACESLEIPGAFLLVPDGFQWSIPHALGLGPPPWPTAARGMAEGVFQFAQEQKRAIIVNDFAADKRMDSRLCKILGITALICAPMWSQEELIGFLVVFDRVPDRTFTAGNAKLLSSIAGQFGNAIENRRHQEEEIEQRRLAQQIEIARSIQEKLLPPFAPPFPGVEIAGRSSPAREVGGDLYDFIVLDDNRLGMVVGDVAGKGIPAAMLMTLTKGVFSALVATCSSPAEVLNRVNRSLSLERIADRFVTLVYYVYDRRDRTATIANAGHEPLLWLHAATGKVDLISNDRLPLGIDRTEEYSQQTIQMEPDDLLLAFTDGFTEAMDPDREPWGANRLIHTLRENLHAPPEALLDACVRAVEEYTQLAPSHDDMTAAVLRAL